MSKYSIVAIKAVSLYKKGMSIQTAWNLAAEQTFPNSLASQVKSCPKNTFLGLAEEGVIKGVPKGNYTKSKLNKSYAINGLNILQKSPISKFNANELWLEVMSGTSKQHNAQMDVVLWLWENGYL